MSFGFSPSDIVTLLKLVTKTYQGWKNACGEYADITSMLDGLCIVLGRIRDEANKPTSLLARNDADREELGDVLRGCRKTVQELNAVVVKFKSLSSSRKKNWDRLRLGVKNLNDLRAKLTQHTTTITAYLEAVGLGSLARIEDRLSTLPNEILQGIDGLAAEIRAGRREGSVMTTYEDDEKDVWKQFRRELITTDGIKSSTIHKYKPLIKQYLRRLAEEGSLEEEEPDYEGEEEVLHSKKPYSQRDLSVIGEHSQSDDEDSSARAAVQEELNRSLAYLRNDVGQRSQSGRSSNGGEASNSSKNVERQSPSAKQEVVEEGSVDTEGSEDESSGGSDAEDSADQVRARSPDPKGTKQHKPGQASTSAEPEESDSSEDGKDLMYEDIWTDLIQKPQTESPFNRKFHRWESQPGPQGYRLKWTLPLRPTVAEHHALIPFLQDYHERLVYVHSGRFDEIRRFIVRLRKNVTKAFLNRRILWLPLREPEDRMDLEILLPPCWRYRINSKHMILFIKDKHFADHSGNGSRVESRLPDIYDEKLPWYSQQDWTEPKKVALWTVFPELSDEDLALRNMGRKVMTVTWTAGLEETNPGMRDHLIEWQERMNNIADLHPETRHLVVCRSHPELSRGRGGPAGAAMFYRRMRTYHGVDHYDISLANSLTQLPTRVSTRIEFKLDGHLYTLDRSDNDRPHEPHKLDDISKVPQRGFHLSAAGILARLCHLLSGEAPIKPWFSLRPRSATSTAFVFRLAFACFFAPRYAPTYDETVARSPILARNLTSKDRYRLWTILSAYIRTLYGTVMYHPGAFGADGFVWWLDLEHPGLSTGDRERRCRMYSLRNMAAAVGREWESAHVVAYE